MDIEKQLDTIITARLPQGAEAMDRVVRAHIKLGGNTDGDFVPLKYPRASDGSTDRPLNHTGRHLLRSLDHQSDAQSCRVTSTFIGARVHQFGATITPRRAARLRVPIWNNGHGGVLRLKRVTIPARPYMTLTEFDKNEVATAIAQG